MRSQMPFAHRFSRDILLYFAEWGGENLEDRCGASRTAILREPAILR